MEKNIRLADIYIKIYNKRPLTMEDLIFLAKYDRECFEKTCRNLIYNMPEAGELLEPMQQSRQEPMSGRQSGLQPDHPKISGIPSGFENQTSQESAPDLQTEQKPDSADMEQAGQKQRQTDTMQADSTEEYPVDEKKEPEIDVLLENLRKMEWKEFPMPNVNADRVKNLLGSLYMEMLFPHNDRYRYFKLEDHTIDSSFNKKA